MQAKKLIEVAMPIKEISAESQRDKSIRRGHISTLHLWWARRPLPACRAVIFSSLVPDPLDENCPKAFKDAVNELLMHLPQYKPYKDIPYTAAFDPMEDNQRHRLMMFIGKFSDKCQHNMLHGITTPPAEQIDDSSLVKWENKDNKEIIDRAQKLIWVAYNSEKRPEKEFEQLSIEFEDAKRKIEECEEILYSIPNRHQDSITVKEAKDALKAAISSFQSNMPMVFDPFAGGGAIPLEAARLGCRSYGNDINPVAHIIEKGSVEYPQKYGKKAILERNEFDSIYGELGWSILAEGALSLDQKYVTIDNLLAFDVEYCAKRIIQDVEFETRTLYDIQDGKRPSVYYWMRFCQCDNCRKQIPLFRQLYLSKPRSNKNQQRIKHFEYHVVNGELVISLENGDTKMSANVNRGNVSCPYCGGITDIESLKKQFNNKKITEAPIAYIYDNPDGKVFKQVDYREFSGLSELAKVEEESIPHEKLSPNSAGGDVLGWGFLRWGQLFNPRQLRVLLCFAEHIHNSLPSVPGDDEYRKSIKTYLAILLDRLAVRMTSLGKWHYLQDTVEHLYGRQAIQMNYDYPELDPFSTISSSAIGQLDSIINYILEESRSPFYSTVNNCSSGDKSLFAENEVYATITDPPYYDAIAYADISDFFYVWLKRAIGADYPIVFSTPQTPKVEECTALKHHHNNSEVEARKHFEDKLTQIFDAIEVQTSDIVSIMFAHQSTEAWTTLCNSILKARMNITGSWPFDTEVSVALKADKGYLESSVTVSCRPSERIGYGDYKEVKSAISRKVRDEVESLYSLGFRGADLLTACFGQAVSEFGKYKFVEKADGSEVQVSDLLEMARLSAFNALVQGVQGDDFTRFYIGWLQMNGMGETDFDDATKFTRVGMPVDVSEIFSRRLLIREGKKQHLATASEHLGNSTSLGTHIDDSLIDQVHRAMLAYEKGDRHILLTLLHNVGADDQSSPFWRLVASLRELLPDGKDLKSIEGLLGNSDNLRQESREVDQHQPEQMTLDFGNDFNSDFK